MRRVSLAALAATILLFPAVPRAAQDTMPVAPFVRVDALSPWLDASHPFDLRVQVANTTELALTDVVLRAAFHPHVITRSELRSALDFGPSSGAFLTLEERAPEPIEPGGQLVLQLRERMGDRITTRGPYPVTITLAYAGGEVTLRTVVPFFPPSEAGRLNVAWALPITGPVLAPGETSAEAIASLRLSELTEILAIVAARAPAPVTLVPSPALVDTIVELDERKITQAALALTNLARAAATVEEIASTTYAPANIPALVAQGPPPEVLRQVTVGRAAVERTTGRSPSLTTFYPPDLALDRDGLDALTQLGVEGLAVAPEAVRETPTEPAKLEPDKFGPAFPFLFGDSETHALIPDLALDQRLATSDEGVLLGQAIVAETLGAWQELPLYAPERVVLLARTPAAPAALATALDGLATAPWVSLTPVADALDLVTASDRVAPARAPQAERPYLTAARSARAELEALSDIALDPPPGLDRLERTLLRAESDTWREDPDAGVALAISVIQDARAIFDAIRVADRRITLTSRTGDAPLTIVNGNPFNVRVRVELVSAKVSFPEGSFRILDLEQGDNTFSFPVEVRATGSFPIDVLIQTADGRRRLTDGTLVVRSTAVSIVSLFVVGGSALFLLMAWTRRAARRNGTRRTVARAAR